MKPVIIHVNRHHIAANTKDGGNRPVYTVKLPNGKTRYGREIVINGPSKLVYDGRRLSCGAVAWLEVEHNDFTIVDEMTYQEAKNSI